MCECALHVDSRTHAHVPAPSRKTSYLRQKSLNLLRDSRNLPPNQRGRCRASGAKVRRISRQTPHRTCGATKEAIGNSRPSLPSFKRGGRQPARMAAHASTVREIQQKQTETVLNGFCLVPSEVAVRPPSIPLSTEPSLPTAEHALSTERGCLSVARFCYAFQHELRGPVWAVGSYISANQPWELSKT